MIVGQVASGEAVVRLLLRGPYGEEQDIEAVIDTGFDGALTLPPPVVDALDLEWEGSDELVLADGRKQSFGVYEAAVIFGGEAYEIYVEEVRTTPLVGMALLEGYALRIECVEGGRVEIEKLPRATERPA